MNPLALLRILTSLDMHIILIDNCVAQRVNIGARLLLTGLLFSTCHFRVTLASSAVPRWSLPCTKQQILKIQNCYQRLFLLENEVTSIRSICPDGPPQQVMLE
jgi:hypothetical protein